LSFECIGVVLKYWERTHRRDVVHISNNSGGSAFLRLLSLSSCGRFGSALSLFTVFLIFAIGDVVSDVKGGSFKYIINESRSAVPTKYNNERLVDK
jgi:hypothetical protein